MKNKQDIIIHSVYYYLFWAGIRSLVPLFLVIGMSDTSLSIQFRIILGGILVAYCFLTELLLELGNTIKKYCYEYHEE